MARVAGREFLHRQLELLCSGKVDPFSFNSAGIFHQVYRPLSQRFEHSNRLSLITGGRQGMQMIDINHSYLVTPQKDNCGLHDKISARSESSAVMILD